MGENTDKKTYRYYSTERPLMPGCCPRAGVYEVKNFDTKTFCEEVGCEAWGYIDYMRELSPDEAADYELLPAGLKTFWGVTTAIDNDGRVSCAITDTVQAAVKPENSFSETHQKGYLGGLVWLQGGSRRAGKGSENGVDRKRMQKQKKYKKNKQKKQPRKIHPGLLKYITI